MNLREILFIGCVVLVLTVCVLGFIGSFFRSPQTYQSVDINSLRLPTAMTAENEPSVVPSEYITLEKELPVPAEQPERIVAQKPQAEKKAAPEPSSAVAVVKDKKTETEEIELLPPQEKNDASERKLVVRKRRQTDAEPVSEESSALESFKKDEQVNEQNISSDRRLVYYKVRRGDSLFKISRSFGVSAKDIANDNKIDMNSSLLAGSRLVLFVPVNLISSGNKIKERDYVVSHLVGKGESLSMIARNYGSTLSDVIKENKDRVKDINVLVAGQELMVPVNNS